MTKLVYIVPGGEAAYSYEQLFIKFGWEITKNFFEADLIQFTGGEDVHPSFYKQELHPKSHTNIKRDEYERGEYLKARELNIPCVGVCRGGQFLNVMNGGSMYQDVDGHANGAHYATVNGGLISVKVTSTHHQMMNPHGDYLILLTAGISKWKERMNGKHVLRTQIYDNVTQQCDIEAVYYPQTNTLCYQPHPEYDKDSECAKLYFNFIEEYFFSIESAEDHIDQENLGLMNVDGSWVYM